MSYKLSIENLAVTVPIKEGKFLVTGATGLIGSSFIDVLLSANDNGCNFTVYALSRSKERLQKRFSNSVIPIVQDITDQLPIELEVDYIIHCASNADPKKYATYPVETMLTNILGNKNILDYCKIHKKTRMLLLSSFEVYGCIQGVKTFTEDMSGIIDQTIIRNVYPESKRSCELLLRSYVDEYEIDGIIARLPSVYGPNMLKDDSKAHAQFIRCALEGHDIVLKSKGLQKRSYSYVIDVVSGLFTILLKGKSGEIYNIANKNCIVSIANLAEICAKIVGTRVVYSIPDEIEKKGFSKSTDCILDSGKIENLGWKGCFSVEEGMRETIEYLMNEKTNLCKI